ncbi:MAG: hypothetical protein KF764_25490 [Labilithrix sp.]|nr:hypothetical protein [Labilithrix sp.]
MQTPRQPKAPNDAPPAADREPVDSLSPLDVAQIEAAFERGLANAFAGLESALEEFIERRLSERIRELSPARARSRSKRARSR